MLSVLMTINYHVAYAEDNSSMDAGETILYYSFETQETKQIGYNSDTHTFYEMDQLPEYLEHDDSAADGDGTADTAPLWSEPGTIYIDEELIKEEPWLKEYLVPKCERLGYCDEDKSCGRKETRKQ